MKYYYEVVLPLPLREPLLYAFSERLSPGTRVIVPVRRRRCVGLVLEEVSEERISGFEVREIEEVLDESPLLPPDLLQFLRWCWEYYLHPPGEVIRAAFPPGFFRELKPRYVLTRRGREALEEGRLPEWSAFLRRPRTLKGLSRLVSPRELRFLEEWIAQGLVEKREDLSGLNPPLESWLERVSEGEGPLEQFLKERGRWPRRFLEEIFGKEEVKKALAEGKVREIRLPRMRKGPVLSFGEPPLPNEEQRRTIEALREAVNKGEGIFLLHGVTGSGKTLVYLEAAAEALARGKSVLVLVPEIAITPYVETHFVARFGSRVAVLHSALSRGARAAEWFRVARGEARVVVGTRSALFAPLRDLGLIVVDEEHEGSYKQTEGLRYQARDMALMRGRFSGATVVLGSATPSVKSYYWAIQGRYRLLKLSRRPQGRRLPEIEVVELSRPGELFTPRLLEAMQESLSAGRQILLFLNRRGYAPVAFCRDCGRALECPNCTLTLTYYRGRSSLVCHHCGFERPAFPVCPHCEGRDWRLVGAGTERVEEKLRGLFPEARIARLDREAITSETRLWELLRRLRAGEVDILIGTQMVAQGHDLPGVSLVGILWAEGGLHLPDFRAAERTFQLLVQVAGRAGRGEIPGKVILQTRLPQHYALQAALRQDYEAFFKEDLALRKRLGFPPFTRLALLIVSAIRSERAEEVAQQVKHFLERFPEVEVLGPVPAPLFRLSARYRWQVLLKSPSATSLDRALRELYRQRDHMIPSGVKLTLDRDPEELL